MSRWTFVLNSAAERARALAWLAKAPLGYVVVINEPKRSTDQNARLWAMLSDIAAQKDWHGVKLTPEDWKLIFMAALDQEMRIVPNLNGTGFVSLGRSSSKLSKKEFSDLFEVIQAWGAEHGVVFHDQREAA